MTATNLSALLVVALATITVAFLIKQRYDSNLPLLFYVVAFAFASFVDRPLNPYIMYTGLILALLLRFEFMGRGFTKFIAWGATFSLVAIIWEMMSDVLA
jgi:hypothetical protein